MNVFWTIVLIIIVGVLYMITQPQSNAQKYTECTKNAGEIYDSGRKKITENVAGYSAQQQAYYYQQTEQGYTADLASCKQLYPY